MLVHMQQTLNFVGIFPLEKFITVAEMHYNILVLVHFSVCRVSWTVDSMSWSKVDISSKKAGFTFHVV